MANRSMPSIIPYLTVQDVSRSLEFYRDAYGFVPTGEPMMDGNGNLLHAEMTHENGMIMMGREGAWDHQTKSPSTTHVRPPVSLYVYVKNVDQHYLKAKEAGARIIEPPADLFWGDRVYQSTCIDGFHWTFATHTGKYSTPPI